MFDTDDHQASIGSNDPQARDGVQISYETQDKSGLPPWFSWPKPPNGFIDLGCVNTSEKWILRMLTA